MPPKVTATNDTTPRFVFTVSDAGAVTTASTATVSYVVRGKEACKGNGWAQFISPKFSNQGQCLSMLP